MCVRARAQYLKGGKEMQQACGSQWQALRKCAQRMTQTIAEEGWAPTSVCYEAYRNMARCLKSYAHARTASLRAPLTRALRRRAQPPHSQARRAI